MSVSDSIAFQREWSADDNAEGALLAMASAAMRDKVYRSECSLFQMRAYLWARILHVYLRLERGDDVLSNTVSAIREMSAALKGIADEVSSCLLCLSALKADRRG